MSDFRLKNEYNIHTLKVSAMEDIEGKGMRSLVNYPVVQGVYAMGQLWFYKAKGLSGMGHVHFYKAKGLSAVGQVVFIKNLVEA